MTTTTLSEPARELMVEIFTAARIVEEASDLTEELATADLIWWHAEAEMWVPTLAGEKLAQAG